MKKPNRYNPIIKYLTHVFCVIIGITFIGSGFLKAVDPWGTALKFEEYFVLYGFDFLLPLSRILAVWLCGAEFMMGCMILFRVRLRLVSIFAMLSMSIFTIVTLLSVTLYPVEDCGCFGDAFHLTAWQTLIKNLVLLPMVITIWWRYRPDKILVYKPREVKLATLFCVVTMGFSAFNFLYLPVIDFLPYKVGVNLLSEVQSTTSDVDYAVVLVCRNIETCELKEFSIDDTQWQDTEKWEWVETRSDAPDNYVQNMASDFSLSSFEGDDVTVDLLSTEGALNFITITNFDKLRPRCEERIKNYLLSQEHKGEKTIVITPSKLKNSSCEIGGQSVECYNVDATILKTLMRASAGIVELENGVITSKKSCLGL